MVNNDVLSIEYANDITKPRSDVGTDCKSAPAKIPRLQKELKTETTNEARAEAACGLCRVRRSSLYEVKKN